MTKDIYLAAIEGGGTTFVVSVARVVCDTTTTSNDDDDLLLQIGPTKLQILHTTTIPSKDPVTGTIPNLTPTQILDETCTFLKNHCPSSSSSSSRQYSAVGIATFGPAGVDPTQRQTYGTILGGSPKREWRGVNLLKPIARACGLDDNEHGGSSKVGFDTDVNAPALAEFRHRCYLQEQEEEQKHQDDTNNNVKKPLTSLSYITIGTGVGVGLILNSHPIHGLLHPEGGHVAIQPLPGDTFRGYSWGVEKSPYGGVRTVEGVASSVALTERYLQMNEKEGEDKERESSSKNNDDDGTNNNDAQGREVLSTISDTHPIWDHASNAIANLCTSLLLLTSCQKIVLGGGIMKRSILYDMIRQRTYDLLNGYLDSVDELSTVDTLKDVIVEGSWKDTMGSGLVGAFALALDAYEKDRQRNIDEDETESKSNETRATTLDDKKDNDEQEQQQRDFTSGVLAGIGLSFGCMLLTSLLGHGHRHRR